MNAKTKRYFWTVAAILTTILSICMAQLLFGCKSPKTGPAGPVTPPVDSTHLSLEKKVAMAKDTAKAAHQRTSQTKQPYENAAANYTAVRDSLLNQ
ncbi:hypothetical protein [Fibrella forsythiae]|uniref:Lipoprotein n=1 Tax=Fibrella forsythiae TaxID=2817061 RepID=A0ABS3JBV6_9BACT|nr:hypothetical protein [Fibrella forsythiae]MBO0946948.1 hypothetical protein [Fibrella forsythiae]